MWAGGAELVTTVQRGELPWEQGWVWRRGFQSALLPEPKPFCARLCVPSLPLSLVPRTPGFWAEPVHWVSSLVWGPGVGMLKTWVPALFTNGMLIACDSGPALMVIVQTPFKCMHRCVICRDAGVTSLQRPSLAVGTKPYSRYQGRGSAQSEGL